MQLLLQRLIQPPPKGGGRCLVLYRQVRRRGALEWTGMYSAGALAIGGFGRSRWRLRRTRRSLSLLYGFSMAVSPFDRPGVGFEEICPHADIQIRHLPEARFLDSFRLADKPPSEGSIPGL
jgi:hypothetical protein